MASSQHGRRKTYVVTSLRNVAECRRRHNLAELRNGDLDRLGLDGDSRVRCGSLRHDCDGMICWVGWREGLRWMWKEKVRVDGTGVL